MSHEDDQPPSEIDRGLEHAFGDKQPKTKSQGDDARPQQVGGYRILDTLGEGGMGTVYLAEQQEPVKRRVALKLIKLGMDSLAIVRRFEQERQALALMDHEGIAKVFYCGTSERGQLFFVMELVKGVPLDVYCEQNRLSLTDRLQLMQQVCGAIQHAHQKAVLHRDLKPANVLVSDVDGKLQVKVIDFGLAKAMGQKLTQESLLTELGMMIGTPEYMAPEQADLSNLDVDTRADIYSLGVMLYQLLVGELPFSGQELREAGLLEMQRVLREVDPLKPSTKLTSAGDRSGMQAQRLRVSETALRRALKGDLDWVVIKALEKDRNRRYESANALAADLQRYLDHEPLEAGPPSAAYRLQKLLRRHRASFTAAGLVLMAVVAGSVATYIQWRSALKLADEKTALAKSERTAKEDAKATAAKLEAKVTDFDQLAGVVRCEEATSGVDRLLEQGPWPQAQGAMAAWLQDCDDLLAMRPGIEATIRSLQQLALPWSEARRAEFAAAEPDSFERWQQQDHVVKSLQRAQAIRAGREPLPAAALTAEQRALDAKGLNELAWDRVAPKPADRKVWNEEAIGLAAAKLAVLKAADDQACFHYLDTLAWAWLANGKDDEARQASAAARAAAPAAQHEAYDGYLAAVKAAVENTASRLAAAEAAFEEQPVWDFASANESQAFLHETLSELLGKLDRLEAEQKVLVARREAWSEQIEQLTRAHPNARVTWSAVREGVAGSDKYAGCDVPLTDADIGSRWLGLVPLGANPVTGLYEFYHLRSACDGSAAAAAEVAIPKHGEGGAIEVGDGTGIVFVLLPGGEVTLGSQGDDADAALYDHGHSDDESLRSVELSPFLLARHEVTKGQWTRIWVGAAELRAPSVYTPGDTNFVGGVFTAAYPVDSVSWTMSRDLLRGHGLSLPTEAQWEYACRGGTTSPWAVAEEELVRYANVADAAAQKEVTGWKCEAWDDGHIVCAPVGSFLPNSFGFYDMHGNVREYCRDAYYFYGAERSGDGLNIRPASSNRVDRGGSFGDAAVYVRSACRSSSKPTFRHSFMGLRAARSLAR